MNMATPPHNLQGAVPSLASLTLQCLRDLFGPYKTGYLLVYLFSFLLLRGERIILPVRSSFEVQLNQVAGNVIAGACGKVTSLISAHENGKVALG